MKVGERKLTDRLLAVLLTFVMLLGMIPAGIMTVGAVDDQSGTASALEFSEVKISEDGKTASLANTTVTKLDASASPDGTEGWFVGVRMTAPNSMKTAEDFDGVKYRAYSSSNSEQYDEKSFWDDQSSDKDTDDTERYINLYARIDEEMLIDAMLSDEHLVKKNWTFDWDKNGEFEQSLTLEIDASSVSLTSGSVIVYPSNNLGIVSPVTDGIKVDNSVGNVAKLSLEKDIKLEWYKADASIGRVSDGWWIGFKVTAPAGFDKDKAQFKDRDNTLIFSKVKDADSEDTMTIWQYVDVDRLTKNLTNNLYSRSFRFDWNGDGVFEQVVKFDIDPAKVTLKNADGSQAFPPLGEVKSDYADISGDKTAKVELEYDGTALTWKEINGEKAWYVEASVSAPSYATNAKYNVKNYGDSDYSGYTSASDFTTLSVKITPDIVKTAKDNNEDIVASWQFDWNGDSKADQTVTFTIDPADLSLSKKDRDNAYNIVFENNSDTINQWIGDGTYTNTLIGVENGTKVTYSIDPDDSEIAVINSKSGEVTLKKDGKVTVKAAVDGGDFYNPIVRSYTLNIVKVQLEGEFKNANPVMIYGSNGNTFQNAVTIKPENAEKAKDPKYSIFSETDLAGNALPAGSIANIDEKTGEITYIQRSGKITVKCEVAGNEYYDGFDNAKYVLTILKADQETLKFEELNDGDKYHTVYDPAGFSGITVGGGSTNGKLTYSVKEDKEGIIDSLDSDSGKIIFKKAGASVVITVTMAGNDCYNPTTNDVTVTVDKADQSGFSFKNAKTNVKFNANNNEFALPVADLDVKTKAEPQFSIDQESAGLATVDEKGNVKISKPGTIKINAHVDGNDCYNEANCTFELTVERDEQVISFEHGNRVELIYGTTKYTNTALFKDVNDKENKGHSSKIEYAITSNDSKLGVSVDDKGNITFTDSTNRVGSFTVKATALEDDYYLSKSIECTYTVKYLDTPKNAYTLSGSKSSESNEWYTGDVTVTARDGYKLSKSNALKEENEWTDSLTYSGDGSHDSENIYLKETSTGFITDIIDIDNFKIDSGIPKADLCFVESFVDRFINNVTFNLFKSATVNFKADVADETSGVSSIEIGYAETLNGTPTKLKEFKDVNKNTESVECAIPLNSDNEFVGFVYVKIVDRAGNEDTVWYNSGVIVDPVAPGIDTNWTGNCVVSVDQNDKSVGIGGTVYRYVYNTDVTLTVNVTEKHLYDEIDSKVKITATKDDVPYDLKLNGWDKDNNVYSNSVTFTDDGTYVVTIEAKDSAGNESVYTSARFTVDKTDPVISTSGAEGGYYNTDQEMKISVSDIDFVPANSKVFVNEDEQTVEWVQSESDKNTWNIKTPLKFDTDGTYNVKVTSADLAAHSVTKECGVIVIDKTKPEIENVNYGDDIVVIDPNSKQSVVGYTLGSDPGTNIIYTTSDTIKFDVAEINFTSANAKIECDYIDYNGNKSNKKIDVKFGNDNNGSFKLDSDGYYKNIKLTVCDLAGNETVYQFENIMINPPAPTFSWDPNNIVNGGFYNEDKTVAFGVNDVLFNENNANIVLTKNGVNVDISDIHWNQTWNKLLDEDGVYHLEFSYANAIGAKATNSDDKADKSLKESVNITFTIDKTAPDKLEINYSKPVNDKTWTEELLKVVTFGAYNYGDEKLTVKLTAYDETAGIDKFVLKYGRQDNVSDKNAKEFTKEIKYSGNEKTATVEYTFDKEELKELQFRGFISFVAYDKVGNSTEYSGDERISIVDSISPTCSVSILPDFSYTNDNTLYFEEKATISIKVEEANFYKDDVNVVVKNLGTSEESNPEIKWTSVGDTHTGVVTIENDGDYVVKIEYTDRSGNRMDEYESAPIHVDHIAPKISVAWDPEDNTNPSIYYQTKERTAEITVTEHNFRAEKFIADITSENVSGACDVNVVINEDNSKTVNLNDINRMLQDINNWTKNGDNYTIKVTFPEAQYNTFKLNCKDAVDNAATEYSTRFVLDETKPSGLDIQYSTPNSKWEWVDELLTKITFGAYDRDKDNESAKTPLEVTLTATDITSGIDRFEWVYVKQNGTSNSNAPSTDKNNPNIIKSTDINYLPDGKAEATFTLNDAEYRGHIEFTAYDKAGNSETKSDNESINIVDSISPTAEFVYENCVRHNDDSTVYFEDFATVGIKINEANFYSDDVKFELYKDGSEITMPNVSWTSAGDEHKGMFTISKGAEYGDGDYSLTVTYTDRSGNKMIDATSTIHIDTVAPKVTVKWDPDTAVANEKYFSTDRKVTIEVIEHNFRSDKVNAVITATDVTGKAIATEKEINKSINEKLHGNEWTHDGDKHTIELTFTEEAQYTFKLNCADAVGNEAKEYKTDFVIDKSVPTDLEISYSTNYVDSRILNAITFGYYNKNRDNALTVTLEATDLTSGIDRFEWRYVKQDGASDSNLAEKSGTIVVEQKHLSKDNKTATVEFTLDDAEYRGHIEFTAVDKTENSNTRDKDGRVNIVDSTAPKRTVDMNADKAVLTSNSTYVEDPKSVEEGANVNLYYNNKADITVEIEEANFYPEDVKLDVTKNGEKVESPEIKWTDGIKDKHTGKFTLSGDGDYSFTLKYADRSGNAMPEYKSQNMYIDTTAPTVTVDWSSKAEAKNSKYYSEERTATITVVDHNFLARNFVSTITAKDVTGKDISEAVDVKAIINYLSDSESWTTNGDTHTAVVSFSKDKDKDAEYTFDFKFSDIVGNEAEKYKPDNFVVDHTAPGNVQITYSKNHVSLFKKLVNNITFGYFDRDKNTLTVTLTTDDITSGVDFFTWRYVRQDGASDSNADSTDPKKPNIIKASNDGSTATATFELKDSEYRGYIICSATDKAGNVSAESNESANRINIVDSIDPVFTATLSEPVRAVNDASLNDIDSFNLVVTNENMEKNSAVYNTSTLYYNKKAEVSFSITEANFYAENVDVKVNDKDISTFISDKKENDSLSWTGWQRVDKTDTYKSTITFNSDGDYVATMTYTDRSGNEMCGYTSPRIVVDKTAPEVYVYYSTQDAGLKDTYVHELDDENGNSVKYYDSVRIATITINEHNFRPSDVKVNIKAVNAAGEPVDVSSNLYKANIASEWTKKSPYNMENRPNSRDDDTYILRLFFMDDANYTFDISYSDLASNTFEGYKPDHFTVDKTRPSNFKVKYEEKVSSAILNAITFGYYGTNVKVTISAEDETSGINKFTYEGHNAEGVSSINKDIMNTAISGAEIKRDGTVFSTSFIVPKQTLTELNSFNGTLKFNAYDKAENAFERDFEDNERLVIDKIAPVCDVTFDPETSNNNNISYYDGNFTATIRINEANFYQEDVDVRVNNTRITPTDWTKSGDVWTSHVSFTDEGSYVLTVNYTDRSGNKMTEFKSNEKIIDKTAPVITVSNIKHESANNGDKIGFTISVTDKNIASASCRPSLNVVVRKADDQGNMRFETVSIALNSPSVSVNAAGETVYTYTVENLDADGYYSLTCSVEDYANHKVSTIGTPVDNGGTSNVETVNFSVNRLGSVFTVETEHNDKYSGDVMTNKLNGAYANDRVKVVVKEINVDRVDVDSDEANKTVVTVNDGSSSKNIGLVEDNNYVKNISEVSGAGGWFETVYTLDNDCFDHDGTYSVDILSYDRANNRNLNTADENAGGTIDFVLDRTLPVITTNIPMKNDTDASSVNASEFNLDINVADNNLDTITVNVDGKQVELNQIGDNSYRTVLAQRSRPYSIDINSSDKAGNKSETYSIDRFTVSTSLFVRWYANTVLFWGVIAAVALLFILLIIFLIVKRRRTNDKDEKAAPVTVKTGKK